MSNDEKIQELNKRIDVELEYSDTLIDKKSTKPDTKKLKKLAKEIRKNLEDYPFETTVYPNPSH